MSDPLANGRNDSPTYAAIAIYRARAVARELRIYSGLLWGVVKHIDSLSEYEQECFRRSGKQFVRRLWWCLRRAMPPRPALFDSFPVGDGFERPWMRPW